MNILIFKSFYCVANGATGSVSVLLFLLNFDARVPLQSDFFMWAILPLDKLDFGEGTGNGNFLAGVERNIDTLTVSEHEDDIEASFLGGLAFVRTLGEKGHVARSQANLLHHLAIGCRFGERTNGRVVVAFDQQVEVAVAGLRHELLCRVGPT